MRKRLASNRSVTLRPWARSQVPERTIGISGTALRRFWMCSKTVHRALVGGYRHACSAVLEDTGLAVNRCNIFSERLFQVGRRLSELRSLLR